MFNSLEVQNGTASRDMRYKIQKWNVNSDKVHSILVANARVDWMYLDDSDITQQFEILCEGILRDVFSQRASSAWQGMQPQRLTVSLLLPCMNGEADEWLDFMQCQRQFWPTMTTRHASLAPIELGTFRREGRLMQSKHLWDTLSIDWHKVDSKLYNAKPTGHSRELLWNHLFVQKHRQNPFQERENWGGPCSGCWFLVRFSDLILGSQDNGFIQERGVVAGTRVGLVILVPVFLGALVAVFLLSWSFFGRYLGCNSVPGHGLDSCVVVWLSFFVAVLVGPFVAVLVVVLLFAFV